MAIVRGVIILGTGWLKSRTRGVVIAELDSRFFPRYAPNPPAGPPNNFSAETPSPAVSAEKCIDLSWKNGTPAPAETEIWVSSDGMDFNLLTTLPLGTTSYRHNVGSFNALRYYRARHVNATDYSAWTPIVSARSLNDMPNAAPSNLAANPEPRPAGETQVRLTWANGDATAQTEVYYRVTGTSSWTRKTTVGSGVTSYVMSGLTPDTAYEFRIRHVKNSLYSSYSGTVAARTLVDGPDAAPTGLVASDGGPASIRLTWSNGDATAATQIYVSTNGSSYSYLTQVSAGVSSYTHDVGSYLTARHYYVRHIKNGVTSADSNTASAVSGGRPPQGAPTLNSVTGGDGTFALSWTNADSYSSVEVYRRVNGGSFVLAATLSAGTTAWTDDNGGSLFAEDTEGSYYLVHLHHGLRSAASATKTHYTFDKPDAAPSSLSATPTYKSASLTWVSGDPTCDSWVYYRVKGLSTWNFLTSRYAGEDGSASFGTILSPDTEYEWKVIHRKTDRTGNTWTLESEVAVFRTNKTPAPTGVSATHLGSGSNGQGGDFKIEWSSPEPSATFELRCLNSSGAVIFGPVSILSWGTTTYTADSDIAPNTTGLKWQVRALFRHQYSSWAEVSASTPAGPAAAPSNNGSSFDPATDDIIWRWSDGDSAASQQYYVKKPDGSTTSYQTSGSSTQTYAFDIGGVQGLYTFYIRHYLNGYFSAWKSWTLRVGPSAAPSGLSAENPSRPTGETAMDLSWTSGDSSAQTEVWYRVSGGSWSRKTTLAAGTSSYRITGLSADTSYEFRVRHLKDGYTSSYSNTVSRTTLTDGPNAAPTIQTPVNNGGGSITVRWTNGDSTAQTVVYRSLDGGSTWTTLGTSSAGATSRSDTLNAGVTATYRVRHVKNAVYSSYSGTASVTTGAAPAGAPTFTTLTGANGDFRLSWTNADNYSKIAVYRYINSGPFELVATLNAGTTSWVDDNGGKYFPEDTEGRYYLRHVNDGFYSGGSLTRTAFTYDFVDEAPYDLKATPAQESAMLKWSKGDNTADSHVYYRAKGTSTWTYYTTLPSYVSGVVELTGLVASTEYEWKVRHEKTDRGGHTWSKDSAVASFTTLSLPAPSSLSASHQGTQNNGKGGVYALSWKNNYSGSGGQFEIEARRTSDNALLYSTKVGQSTTSHTTPSVAGPSTGVTFRVRLTKNGAASSWASLGVTTPSGPTSSQYPTNRNSHFADGYIKFQWNRPGSFYNSEYYIRRGTTTVISNTQTNTDNAWYSPTEPGTYTLYIRTYHNGYVSNWNNFSVTVGPSGTPFNVWAYSECYRGEPRVEISWHHPDPTSDTEIWISYNGSTFSHYATVYADSGQVRYEMFYPHGGRTIWFKVRYRKHGLYSAFSSVTSVTTEYCWYDDNPLDPPWG